VAQRLDAASEQDAWLAERSALPDALREGRIEPVVRDEFAKVKESDQSRAPASQSEATEPYHWKGLPHIRRVF